MTKDINKKRKQDLGIFYTPQEVVDFIFDILNIWKNKDDKETHRWQTRKPKAHYPSVIDPACGEGVFLKTAVTSGFTGYHPTEKTPYVFGVDMDGEVVERWERISILHDLFKGNRTKMLNHFHQQDGLLALPEKVFNYKTGGLKEFDAVVGNPPYGGIGFSSLKEKSLKESIEILEHLRKYEVLVYRKRKSVDENQTGLFGSFMLGTTLFGGGSSLPSAKEVESLPIEILFVDRFIQLAKPGGWIAIIIPDGILTNSNSHYVRDYVSNKAKVEAIISLPRETFKNAGTSAKTSILFLRKYQKDEKVNNSHSVFLASVEKIAKEQFDTIVKVYEKNYNLGGIHMDKSNYTQITRDQNGRETVMVRVDKSLKDLMEEKPFSRWNVDYWNPRYEKIYATLRSLKSKTLEEIEGKNCLISGDHVRKSRGETKGYKLGTGIEYYETKGFLPSSYNYSDIKECSRNAFERLKATSVKRKDILISCAGVGGVGKAKTSIILHEPKVESCTGDVFILRVKRLNPHFLYIFLNSTYGHLQILRQQAGTGTVNINSEQVLNLLIPEIPNQNKFESEYLEILKLHDNAMESKKKGDNKMYRESLNIAESMLKELIKKTEEVIEDKREDVN